MKTVIVAAALILALMVVVKDGRVLRMAGLTGGCTPVATPRGGQPGAWERCVPGKLEGAPDLSGQGCTSEQSMGKIEFWRCPDQLGSGQGT
ncbi:MAG TPA: hypothetical protein VEH52_07850 [Gaiellaceae bacterium]|nr:hypothetical protein [Gaiellaceae bacterium]